MYFNLDYFYMTSWINYLFLRTPKLFFEDIRFLCVTFDARMFFSFLIDRMSLSIKNGWQDSKGRIYIYYTLKDAMTKTGFGHTKMCHIFAELENIGLIERVRQGQGKPMRIYVKNFCALLNDGFVPASQENGSCSRNEYAQMTFQDYMEMEAQTKEHEKKTEQETDGTPFVEQPEAAREESEPPVPLTPYDEPSSALLGTEEPLPENTPEPSSLLPVTENHQDTSPAALPFPPVLDRISDTEAPKERGQAGECGIRNVENVENFSTNVENKDTSPTAPAPSCPPGTPLTSAEGKSGLPLFGSQDFRKTEANKNKRNKTEFTQTDPSYPPVYSRRPYRSDWWKKRMEEIERCKEKVRFQIGYERLAETRPYDMEEVDDYVELIADVLCSREDHLYVSHEDRPIAQVRNQFEKLTYEHIIYILDCMMTCKTDVTNVRAYMLATLFNAPNTIRTYYGAKVRHDMSQDDWYRDARAG